MKRTLLGTPLGRFALTLRDSIQLASAASTRLEVAGTIANDRLAYVLVTRLCQASKTFVDVGAHIGSVFSEAAHQVPSAKIVAFEAIPEKVDHIRRKFPAVECHHCALGESEGEVTFYVNRERSGFSSLGRPKEAEAAGVEAIRVPMKPLDRVLEPGGIDLVKIDVEGAELGVLRGGERLISAARPVVMFESAPVPHDGLGYTKDALWQWFADHEYGVLVPNRVAHQDPGLCKEAFLESHLYPRRTTNYFAVPRERRDEVRDRARLILKVRVG